MKKPSKGKTGFRKLIEAKSEEYTGIGSLAKERALFLEMQEHFIGKLKLPEEKKREIMRHANYFARAYLTKLVAKQGGAIKVGVVKQILETCIAEIPNYIRIEKLSAEKEREINAIKKEYVELVQMSKDVPPEIRQAFNPYLFDFPYQCHYAILRHELGAKSELFFRTMERGINAMMKKGHFEKGV